MNILRPTLLGALWRPDLVAVRGDPLRTPSRVYDVTLVFRDGVGYDSARLQSFARGKVGIY